MVVVVVVVAIVVVVSEVGPRWTVQMHCFVQPRVASAKETRRELRSLHFRLHSLAVPALIPRQVEAAGVGAVVVDVVVEVVVVRVPLEAGGIGQ